MSKPVNFSIPLLLATSLVFGLSMAKEPLKSGVLKKRDTTTSSSNASTKSAPNQKPGAVSATPVAPVSERTTVEKVVPASINPDPSMNSPLLSPAVGEQIKWQVIAGGGGRSTSASYVLSGTIGQTAAGPGTSASYKLNSGFWQNFDNGSGCCDVAGDADNGGDVNIGDVTFLIAYIFSGGAAPVCTREADADAGGDISIGDAVYLIAYIFQGGPAPICGP